MLTDKETVENLISQKLASGKKKFGVEFEIMVLEIIGLQKLLTPENEKRDREIPLVRWNDYHPDPSVKALRMYVFRREENGFDAVLSRRDGRWLIKEDAFFEWRKNRERGKI